MRAISVSVSESDYEEFRRAAREQGRPVAQLIREAMALYREERLMHQGPLRDVPVLLGHRPVDAPPPRSELYDELFER